MKANRQIEPAALRDLLAGAAPPALLDVREAGEYNTAHIPGFCSLPRRLIEARLVRLVPCRAHAIALCDSDGRRAALAAETAERMGYADVTVLAGGVNRWASEGLPTEWGSNVPSKDFGEAVEVRHHVPTVSAQELQARIAAGEQLVILDTRTPEEYRRACIPGGRSLPGGELARHIADIVHEQPGATVVVNCAGRTRSIIGARVLQRMGVPAVSLRNGTSGWVLAGLELERGAGRTELPPLSDNGRAAALAFARRVAAEDGARLIGPDEAGALLAGSVDRCLYPIDVRSEAEYAAGHIPGFWWFPGGQAVQRSDDLVAVRDGTIIFACDDGARSAIAASWFRQMGFPNVCALAGGTGAWTAAGRTLISGADEPEVFGLHEAEAALTSLAPHELKARLGAEPHVTVLFVDSSDAFARGHVPGAIWLPRGWLELRIAALAPRLDAPLVLSDADGRQAPLAARTLRERGYRDVAVLHGGMRAWHAAELPLERGLSGVMSAPEDVVPAGPDRTQADIIHYLSWEEALGRKYA
ncbi:MAG TPA: rhodanese-like domain-containing protein [Dehalococcoidia bacterium]|nr:rhodanese-like domain-containing protein [Dehalococcoidia bacterium]